MMQIKSPWTAYFSTSLKYLTLKFKQRLAALAKIHSVRPTIHFSMWDCNKLIFYLIT